MFAYQSISTRGYLLGKRTTEVFGKIRYGLNTVPNIPVRFITNSIYTNTRHFGNFSTPSNSSPGTPYRTHPRKSVRALFSVNPRSCCLSSNARSQAALVNEGLRVRYPLSLLASFYFPFLVGVGVVAEAPPQGPGVAVQGREQATGPR